ncbi:hypothetical protein DPMN_111995 [Dreissena polymorpha]|uniref:Uncharacterized protein n=1 Tax=Dreissena polymorpha TaxID=45954 RepID=A0A9D4KG00_DREPO|nr:hypothetical protein DPMN_111995 [Dreissena polymorpha]
MLAASSRYFAHLRGFHDDWAKNVTSRVQPCYSTDRNHFQLNSHIKETNVLTKFHEKLGQKCFHYIHIEKNAPPTGDHVFSPIWTIFELVRDINKTNCLQGFFLKPNKENCPPPTGSHVIQLTGTLFELNSHIKETNFTCFHYIHIEKNAPPTGGHVFSPIWTIFELVRDINKTNVLTNFHVFTRILYSQIRKTAPPTGGHVFQRTRTTFELNQHIIKTNILTNFELDRDFIETKLLTKFHEDWTINVASRVFTNKCGRTDRRWTKTGHKSSPEQSASPVSKHLSGLEQQTHNVCPWTQVMYRACPDIIGTNLLTKFHEYRKINVASRVLTRKNAPPHGSHVFQPTGIIFYLFQDIIRMNLLTKFHEDRTVNVASRVKNAPPLGSHTNLLTKFHEDWSINVASRLLTRKNAPPPGCHVFQPTCIIFQLVQDIIGMKLLTEKNAPPL